MATIETNNYNAKTKTLQIIFGYDTEKMYTYKDVPAKIAKDFDKAESKGKFFHANIRPKFESSWEYVY